MTKETRISAKPHLYVDFHASDDQITNVVLTPNDGQGFIARVHCKQPQAKLHELILTWMRAYATGSEPNLELPMSLQGLPPYTFKVLTAMQRVHFGDTASYRDLAVKTGKPLGARAVGNACGRNPLPLIIPCHRILASDGTIGGYSSGLEIKRRLLDFEGIVLD